MKKSMFILILLCFTSQILNSQKEAFHWYFGNVAGLDFSSGSLELDPNGKMQADHGSAVISDENGNLLFYTNGTLVWNKNHEVMPNGILEENCAGEHTMQNCAIVPKVGDQNQFYVFTIQTIDDDNKGLNYNIVDLSLDDNKGDVVETSIYLTDSLLVGSALTRHANETDYWFVVRTITLVSNNWQEKWLSYLIDENGINLTSVYLPLEEPFLNNISTSGKFSPNGKFLYWGGKLFDFDNATGDIISYRSLDNWGWASNYTNGEFSPKSDILYATTHGSTSYTLDQFDLNSSDLAESKIAIDLETDGNVYIKGGLQLAPDGKIYVSYLDHIGVIHNPSELGIACNLEQDFIDVPGKAKWSFPSFSSHYFNEDIASLTGESSKAHSNIHTYPNPTSSAITISMDENFIGGTFSLTDMQGRLIDQSKIESESIFYELGNLAKGFYMISLANGGDRRSELLVVE